MSADRSTSLLFSFVSFCRALSHSLPIGNQVKCNE
jgi:hypothetical protein